MAESTVDASVKTKRRVYHFGRCPSCNIEKKLSQTFNRNVVAFIVMAVAGSLLQFQERGVGFDDDAVCFQVCHRCFEKYHEARKVAEADINFELLYPNSAKRQRAIMLRNPFLFENGTKAIVSRCFVCFIGPFPLPACESCSAASKAVTRILCLGFPEVQAFMPETFKGRIPHQTQVNPTMIISLIVLLPPVTSSPEFGDCDDLPLSCDKRETSHPDPPTTSISNCLKLQRVLTFSSVSHSMRKQNTS